MKIKLPLFGQIVTGKDAIEPTTPSIVSIETPRSAKTYDVLGGLLSFSKGGLSNEKSISSRLLEANKEWVYRNNDVISQEVSKMDFELFSMNLRGGEIEFNEIEDHPLLDLLDRFNPRTTKQDGLYTTQSHKKLTGDAFWLLDKNGQSVENIYILPPDKIELVLADPTAKESDLVSAYKYEDTIDGKRISEVYDINQIIHFKKPNPKNPFRGYGAVEALADTIDADNLTNETQRNFFEKGAISNFVLTTDNKITQEQLKRIRAELRAMYTGAQNAFTTMIFGNGLKPSEIGFSNKDMEFLDLLEWYRDKIMIGFGNTKASLGIIDDVNRASFEGSLNGWMRSTVKPDMDSITATINEFLVPMFGENLILGYKDPIEDDITSDVAQAVSLKNAGIMQVNEARELVGLDPVDGGDVFAPSNNVTNPFAPTQDPNANTNDQPLNDPNATDTPEQTTPPKMFRRTRNVKFKNLPNSLKHVDVMGLVRQRGMFFKKKINQDFKEAVKPMVRKIVESKKHKPIVKEDNNEGLMTPAIIDAYYKKQDHIVDIYEKLFYDSVLKLLTTVKEQSMNNFESEVKGAKSWAKFIAKKDLFNEEDLKTQAQIDLTPILLTELVLAGQEAFSLMGIEDTYVPFKVQETVRSYVDLFATSMLNTDKDYLTQLIADGFENGDSITEIRDRINNQFGDYTKTQAERIARTETSRVSNLAAEDAFIQSGVVEAKQWLIAPGACPQCLPYAGKIVKVRKDFYKADDSGFQDGNPPLHVSCRCKILPVVTGEEAPIADQSTKVIEAQQARIVELEAQADKRTKEFKKIKAESIDDKAYIKALEKYTGADDGNA